MSLCPSLSHLASRGQFPGGRAAPPGREKPKVLSGGRARGWCPGARGGGRPEGRPGVAGPGCRCLQPLCPQPRWPASRTASASPSGPCGPQWTSSTSTSPGSSVTRPTSNVPKGRPGWGAPGRTGVGSTEGAGGRCGGGGPGPQPTLHSAHPQGPGSLQHLCGLGPRWPDFR